MMAMIAEFENNQILPRRTRKVHIAMQYHIRRHPPSLFFRLQRMLGCNIWISEWTLESGTKIFVFVQVTHDKLKRVIEYQLLEIWDLVLLIPDPSTHTCRQAQWLKTYKCGSSDE